MPSTNITVLSVSPVVYLGVAVVGVVMVFMMFMLLLVKQYKRCPPNRILVIFGKTGHGGPSAKVIRGGAAFVWPMLQDHAYLSMEPMQIDLPKELRGRTVDKGLKLPQTWSFAISADPQLIQNAAIRLVGLPKEEIERIAADLIAGRIEKSLHRLDNAVGFSESTDLLEAWAKDVDSDLAQVGLVTIGYR